jgi:hypothetical protein
MFLQATKSTPTAAVSSNVARHALSINRFVACSVWSIHTHSPRSGLDV